MGQVTIVNPFLRPCGDKVERPIGDRRAAHFPAIFHKDKLGHVWCWATSVNFV